ncbi:DMT family transporter [Salinibacterium sp. SYSU T00001]|uniref:DMT family transporter n=1 Tax=Homoserinimonas sedimenticola TaxID=2986805 RepID=UPI0022365672|nr:DMT family transporter [Salinibacterium sedimenticola]MCW4386093.1 DMT family transporter [Salinibacterium sedimenticola]
MEANLRWGLVTAVAPIAWGTTYFVTQQWLPAETPLWGGAIRALPAGLLLLAIRRRLPRGEWWWKALVLGSLNMGAFFALIYVSAQLLPSSIATTIMATSPMAMMLIAWPIIRERPRLLPLAGAVLGVAGVFLMVATGASAIDPLGVLASLSAIAISSVGYILTKKWNPSGDLLSVTSWQLIAGGLVLLPIALAVEGAPPTLDPPAVAAFAYISVVATALAYVAWFSGLRHLAAGTVGLIGLLNPVTGVLLGTLAAAEVLEQRQVLGLALVLVGILLGQPLFTRLRRGRMRR